MIPNHEQFIAAIKEGKKVSVRFYSKADNGVLDRICAPITYGQGGDAHDDLNRYWLWDYAGNPGPQVLGLVPQQIVELQVLGLSFNPEEFVTKLPPQSHLLATGPLSAAQPRP